MGCLLRSFNSYRRGTSTEETHTTMCSFSTVVMVDANTCLVSSISQLLHNDTSVNYCEHARKVESGSIDMASYIGNNLGWYHN